MKVVIVGGGFAGISAACELVQAGYEVELIEAQSSLAGTYSAQPDSEGDWLEKKLYRFSRADRAVLALLERAGLSEHIRWSSRDLIFALPGGRVKHVPFPNLPAGLGALSAILANELFHPLDKLKSMIGLSSAWLGSEHYRASCDDRSYAQWHADHSIPKHVLDDCFDPIARTLSGLTAKQVSARAMLELFQALSVDSQSAGLGLLDGSSETRLFAPLAEYLTAQNCRLRLGERAQTLQIDQYGVQAVQLESGQCLQADGFVLALQPPDLLALLPEQLYGATPFAQIGQLEMLPSMLVQLWFDQYVHYGEHLYFSSHVPFCQFGDLALCAPHSFDRHNGSLVALEIAPAQPWWDQDDAVIIKEILSDLRRFWPGVRSAQLLKSAIVRTAKSRFANIPNSYRLRPKATTPFHNLVLSGDWLAVEGLTIWERAARSGQIASHKLIQAIQSYATLKH